MLTRIPRLHRRHFLRKVVEVQVEHAPVAHSTMLRNVSTIPGVAVEADRDARRVLGARAPRFAVVVPGGDREHVALPTVEGDYFVPNCAAATHSYL
jgi:hypothetical protein